MLDNILLGYVFSLWVDWDQVCHLALLYEGNVVLTELDSAPIKFNWLLWAENVLIFYTKLFFVQLIFLLF